MPNTYLYRLSSGIQIKVSDNLGPFNEWEESPPSNKLVVSSGMLGSQVPPKICTSAPLANPQPVVTLHGASWNSEVGATGQATVHLGVNTPGNQTWTLVEVD
jgi:hypothetical protein